MAHPNLTVVPDLGSSLEHPNKTVLYYIHDPMCAWCWAFRPVWAKILGRLPEQVMVQGVLGGLAPDSDHPMPKIQRTKLQKLWKTIQHKVPGTEFNFDYWRNCTPRRTTYEACRAVIAAKLQHEKFEEWMVLAIQVAYYLDARNPAEKSTLVDIASSLGLETVRFAKDLNTRQVNTELQVQIEFSRSLGVYKFPALVLKHHDQFIPIDINYRNPNTVLKKITQCVKGGSVGGNH